MPKSGLPLKYPGGKAYVASRVIKLMEQRPHLHYVEPYCGGCQVLFARDPERNWMTTDDRTLPAHQQGCSEMINDICGELTNFYSVLQEPELFSQLERRLSLAPFSEQAWRDADDFTSGSQLDRAVKFFLRSRLSRGGEGREFATPVRTRTRGRKQEQVNAFLTAIDGLNDVHERIRRVMVLNRDAIDVVRTEDDDHTLFYLDPPYPQSTRVSVGQYRFEMSDDDHRDMLDAICQCKGAVILSSYPNSGYSKLLSDWNTIDIPLKKAASCRKKKPTAVERLWFNF